MTALLLLTWTIPEKHIRIIEQFLEIFCENDQAEVNYR